MMGPAEVFIALIVVGLPVILLMIIANRFFRLREKKLEVEAGLAAEKAAQYASRSQELEQRVRVLEQIVTDGGMQTAAQIEALRASPPLKVARQKHTSDAEQGAAQ
jgi:ABC-type phosphate transport system auxiliary subunit